MRILILCFVMMLSGCSWITGAMNERTKEESNAAHNTAKAAYCRGTLAGVLLRMDEAARQSFLDHCLAATDNGQN